MFVNYFFVLFSLTFSIASAFTIPTTFTRGFVLSASDKDEGEGGAAIAVPKTGVEIKIKTKTKTEEKVEVKTEEEVDEPEEEKEFEEAPQFQVLLIGDEDYEQVHVVERITQVMDDIAEDQALDIYKSAQASGQAMIGMYPFEYAELYKEQLLRSTPMIFSDIKETK